MAKRASGPKTREYDPEDEFFGDADNTRASFKSMDKRPKTSWEPVSRNKVDKRFLRAALDAEITAGRKASRRELNLLSTPSDDDIVDHYDNERDDIEFEDRVPGKTASSEEGIESEEDPIIFRQSAKSERQRGLEVLQQQKLIQQLLVLRFKMQPLLLGSDRLSSGCVILLADLERALLGWLAGHMACDPAVVTEHVLQSAKHCFQENHVQKANLKTLGPQHGWQQVQEIMGNEDVLGKHRTRLFGDGQTLTDGDLLSKLASHLNSPTIATMSLQAFQTANKPKQHRGGVDPKATKGRRLNYHVQDRLMGYMTARRVDDLGNDAWWPQSRIDDLFRSLIR
jgi:hypothetical protein